jgi:hypothetical protein
VVNPTTKTPATAIGVATNRRYVRSVAVELAFPTVRQLARRILPQAVVASVVPALILIAVLPVAGPAVAIASALAWTVALTAIGWVVGRPASGLSILSLTRLTLRSAVAIAAGSTFVYFVQGSIGGLCLAIAFLASATLDRPLARRFARDFCDLPERLLHHPGVHRTLRRMSVMWGFVGLAHATTGFLLLVSLPTTTYLVVNPALSVAVPAAALAVSTTWFRRAVVAIG